MNFCANSDVTNFVSLPLKFDNPYHHTVNINDIDSHLLQAAHQYKGQAHDMFSRTLQIQIYQYFLPNIVWFVCLDFLKCSNLRKIALFRPIKKLFSFSSEKYWWIRSLIWPFLFFSVRFLRLLLVILYAVIDTGWAIYRRYNHNSEKSYQKISVVAHLSGAVAGLLVGIIVLKNRKVHTWEIKLKILCIITYAIFIGGCILWNVMADSIMSEPFFPSSQDYNTYENCSSAP